MFNVVICTVNRTTQTDGIQREKAALNSHWENSVSFDFSFSVEERSDFIHAIAANKRAESHNNMHFNPLTPMSDQDRISPNNINTISTRQVRRTRKISIWG